MDYESTRLVQIIIKIAKNNRIPDEEKLSEYLREKLSKSYKKYRIVTEKRTPRYDYKSKNKPKKDWDLALCSDDKIHIGVEFKVETDANKETVEWCINNEWEVSKKNPCADKAIIFTINHRQSQLIKNDLDCIKKIHKEYRDNYNKKTHYVYLETYNNRSNPIVVIDGIRQRGVTV